VKRRGRINLRAARGRGKLAGRTARAHIPAMIARPPFPTALVVLAAAACGAPSDASLDARVTGLLAAYDGADRPGACLLARRAGVVLYERCFGLAVVETGEPATPETGFRLASLTKQFTATAALLLVADGRLTTGTTLRAVFPRLPAWADAVTLHHLLTHTSGLVDYEDVMPPGDAQITDAGVLDLLAARDSTGFAPGSGYRYSNSGYAVLARIVEEVSGRRFGPFLAERIFGPVGMAGTVAHVDGQTVVPHRAFGYSRADGGWTRTDQSPTSAVLGDGGIYTSARDLNRWLAVVEGRDALLPADLAAAMFTPHTPADGEASYGYGWFLDRAAGRRRYRHEGTTIGFRNAVQRFPDDDLTVVLLTNRNEIAEGLVDALVAALRAGAAAEAGTGSESR
jgi:CubicO group peptidase (beta-lactamase class C family)